MFNQSMQGQVKRINFTLSNDFISLVQLLYTKRIKTRKIDRGSWWHLSQTQKKNAIMNIGLVRLLPEQWPEYKQRVAQ